MRPPDRLPLADETGRDLMVTEPVKTAGAPLAVGRHDPGAASVLKPDGSLGAGAHCLHEPAAQLLRRMLVEHVEEVVVSDLEHFRDDAHAKGVALTEVEIDDNAHWMLRGLQSVRRRLCREPRPEAPQCT